MNQYLPDVSPDADMHGINVIYPNDEGEGHHVAYFLVLPESVSSERVAELAKDMIRRAYEAGRSEVQAEEAIIEQPDVDSLRRENAALRESVQQLTEYGETMHAERNQYARDHTEAMTLLQQTQGERNNLIEERDTLAESIEQLRSVSQEDQITTLQCQLNEAIHERDQARVAARGWENDFWAVARSILNEAIRRDWCSEYDEWCRETGGQLRYGHLLARVYEVTGKMTLDLRFSRNHGDQSPDDMFARIATAIAQSITSSHPGGDYELTDWSYEDVEEEAEEEG